MTGRPKQSKEMRVASVITGINVLVATRCIGLVRPGTSTERGESALVTSGLEYPRVSGCFSRQLPSLRLQALKDALVLVP